MSSTPRIKQRLLTPGPTQVPEEVLREMAQSVIHHRTEQFKAIFADLSERLKRIFCTQHPVLTITGSGTTAFEAAQTSLISPGEKAVTCAGGKFAERWQDVYESYGIKQVRIDVPWGEAVQPAQIERVLQRNPDARVVTIVHSETSTSTVCDVRAIAQIVAGTDALLVVDGITSVAALPVEMDAWGIDVVVAGSQKALMLPPGLGYVALGPRAQRRLQEVSPRSCYSLDLRRWLASFRKTDVPFTPSVNLIRGQRVALQMIEDEGLEHIQARTARFAAATRAALKAMGLELISSSPSDSVTGAFYPGVADGGTSGTKIVDDKAFRAALRDRHGIHIAGGQDGRLGNFRGRIFRISHMGYVSAEDTLETLVAIETELIAAGYGVEPGTALTVARSIIGLSQ